MVWFQEILGFKVGIYEIQILNILLSMWFGFKKFLARRCHMGWSNNNSHYQFNQVAPINKGIFHSQIPIESLILTKMTGKLYCFQFDI